MVSVGDSPAPAPPSLSSPSAAAAARPSGRSMRTLRSPLSFAAAASSEILTDSAVDLRLFDLVRSSPPKPTSPDFSDQLLALSHSFSDFSPYSSDISGELARLASAPAKADAFTTPPPVLLPGGDGGVVSLENEDLDSVVQICVERLQSDSVPDRRSAAAKLRLLAKNLAENRALIGSAGAIPALVPLLRSTDPSTQEHAATALLNLSLYEPNKALIADAGSAKPLVYALKTGMADTKQNAAYALLRPWWSLIAWLGYRRGRRCWRRKVGFLLLWRPLRMGLGRGRSLQSLLCYRSVLIVCGIGACWLGKVVSRRSCSR